MSFARLLKRVLDIDIQHCPNRGAGELKIVAAILARPVIEKILSHMDPRVVVLPLGHCFSKSLCSEQRAVVPSPGATVISSATVRTGDDIGIGRLPS